VVVGRPGSFIAVQVKSTVFELEQGWVCKVRSGKMPYPRGSFDYLAAYIVFEDAGTSFRKKKFKGWRIFRSTPGVAGRIMRSIARRGVYMIPMLARPAASTAFRDVRKNSQQNPHSRCHHTHTPSPLASLGMAIASAILSVIGLDGLFFHNV
jgi:hypothetical protein